MFGGCAMPHDAEGRYYPACMAAPGPSELRGLLWEWRKTLPWPHQKGCGSGREGSLEDCSCRPAWRDMREETAHQQKEAERRAAHARADEAIRKAYGH